MAVVARFQYKIIRLGADEIAVGRAHVGALDWDHDGAVGFDDVIPGVTAPARPVEERNVPLRGNRLNRRWVRAT